MDQCGFVCVTREEATIAKKGNDQGLDRAHLIMWSDFGNNMEGKAAGFVCYLDVQGTGKGGIKDDLQISGLSDTKGAVLSVI